MDRRMSDALAISGVVVAARYLHGAACSSADCSADFFCAERKIRGCDGPTGSSAYIVLEQLKAQEPRLSKVAQQFAHPPGPRRRSSPQISPGAPSEEDAQRVPHDEWGVARRLSLPALCISHLALDFPRRLYLALDINRPSCLVFGRAHAGPGSADGQEWVGSKSKGKLGSRSCMQYDIYKTTTPAGVAADLSAAVEVRRPHLRGRTSGHKNKNEGGPYPAPESVRPSAHEDGAIETIRSHTPAAGCHVCVLHKRNPRLTM
jgi:hypothetical protein